MSTVDGCWRAGQACTVASAIAASQYAYSSSCEGVADHSNHSRFPSQVTPGSWRPSVIPRALPPVEKTERPAGEVVGEAQGGFGSRVYVNKSLVSPDQGSLAEAVVGAGLIVGR